jgi:hypothetical protein
MRGYNHTIAIADLLRLRSLPTYGGTLWVRRARNEPIEE